MLLAVCLNAQFRSDKKRSSEDREKAIAREQKVQTKVDSIETITRTKKNIRRVEATSSKVEDKSFYEKNTEMQHEIRTKLSRTIRKIKDNDSKNYIFIALGIAFLYGIIHSLGPGHGKIFMVGQVVASRVNFLSIIGSSLFFAFLHSLSGLTLVGILKLLSVSILTGSTKYSMIGLNIAYGIFIILGFYMLFSVFFGKTHQHTQDKKGNLYLTALAIGLVPCPGTVVIAVYAMQMDMFGIGLFMVIAMAMGMATTLVTLNLMAHFTKTVSTSFIKSQKTLEVMAVTFKIIGALIILSMGTLLLLPEVSNLLYYYIIPLVFFILFYIRKLNVAKRV